MTDVLKELQQWAVELPFWEQFALDKILFGNGITDSDYDEFLRFLLEDADLVESTSERPELRLLQTVDVEPEAITQPVCLRSVSNLRNVNALVSGQKLTFGPALTAVYGGNGSGKSGYSRILGCAGFTRGDDFVLPDITQPVAEGMVPAAEIEIEIGDETNIIDFQVGSHYPELGCFYMFDSTAARAHLNEKQTITFSPYGLSALTNLADVTDKVRERLQALIAQKTDPRDFGPFFQGESEIKNLVIDLGSDTDLEALRKAAVLTGETTSRLKNLDIEIAKLKAENVSETVSQLQQTIADLQTLSERLDEVEQSLSDETASDVNSLVVAINALRNQEGATGISEFQSEYFTQIGTSTWLQFIRAARDLAQAEQPEGEPYPRSGDHCLLCQQPLPEENRILIHRLWEFLEAGASVKLAEAQTVLADRQKALNTIELDFFDEQSVSHRHLQTQDKELLEKIVAFVGACRVRYQALEAAISDLEPKDIPALPSSCIAEVRGVVETLNDRCQALEQRNVPQEIERLQAELVGLEHRITLTRYLPEIEEYVLDLRWAHKAQAACGDTGHITRKHGRLFSRLVTDRYLELFRQTLEELGCPLKVRIKTTGSKGNRFKQLIVEMDNSAPDRATPDRVLSEGEKRAVALADFLTEVTLDEGCTTVVLDDPVTSLDADWKQTIAIRVVVEAQRRQVIVFTHDLPFLYLITRQATEAGIELAAHWIKRGDSDNKPGYVWLDNSPAHDKDYRKPTKAREWHKIALDAPPGRQEDYLKSGFGALRTTYEAFIIFELFNEVVFRFDDRISPGRLRGITWDDAIVNETVDKHEALSRYIEGHLHGDVSPSPVVTPKILLDEILAFEALQKRLNQLKKARKIR